MGPVRPLRDADAPECRGETLCAGQLIFSGGLTAPVPVAPGAGVTFDFDRLGSSEVTGSAG